MKVISGKVVVLGQQGVGKTSLAIQYAQKAFHNSLSPTIGASFFSCNVPVGNETTVKLQVWDTSGQERFKAMAPMFYRNANAALLVYDITQHSSFESMKRWVAELKRQVDEPMVLCVVGNKVDLEEKREVSRDDAICYAKTIGANHYECSAKDNKGVDQVFLNIASGLCRLCGEDKLESLQVYECEDVSGLEKTGDINCVGKIEDVNLSIGSVAHGNSVGYKCC